MKKIALLTLVLSVACALGIGRDSASGRSPAGARSCRLFPRDNPWHQRVDGLPVLPSSAAIVRSIGLDRYVHADFGSGTYDGGPIGIPFTTVSRGQSRVPVAFDYADESDRGPYPIPRDAPIEGGSGSDGDRHVIVVDRDRCRLYELYAARPVDGGSRWTAGSGAIWNLRSNRLRPRGWTSADAAGLPILPGLARFEELRRGGIDHALRFTAPRTRRAFVYPARHLASDLTDPALPAMGQRLRLKKSFRTSGFPPQARAVLKALKRYGMLLADNGSPWFVSGAPSRGWDNDDLHRLQRVHGSDFEVVDTRSLPKPRR
jgi:hypothetical protein